MNCRGPERGSSHKFICFIHFTGVDSDAANQVMDLIREKYVGGELLDGGEGDDIQLVQAEEFGYVRSMYR